MGVNKIINNDCIEGLKELENNSVDSIVTDPPYELKFMNKKWDGTGIAYNVDMWKECLRVLKPGGHLLSFGGTRTYHRMACAIEDAGFEIRDQIQWLYGSGFPKSYNISKGIDKKLGKERKVVGKREHPTLKNEPKVKANAYHVESLNSDKRKESWDITAPATEESQYWDGWGTALKPANEPIVLARKPLGEKTIVDNLLKWGTGGINIDECRIDLKGEKPPKGSGKPVKSFDKNAIMPGRNGGNGGNETPESGRFPANVILDEEAGEILDSQSGTLKSGGGIKGNRKEGSGMFGNGKAFEAKEVKADSGGASRFFYCAKVTSKKEKGEYNTHPTVKPIKLMEYLVNLATPKGGTVLDPFSGSGTTLLAAKNTGFNYIGIEKEEEYISIIEKRLEGAK